MLKNASPLAATLAAFLTAAPQLGLAMGTAEDDVRSTSGGMAFGGGGDDVLRARGNVSALLAGEAGDDRLLGGHGDDTLLAGDGNDSLQGGFGSDILFGGAGTDGLLGGGGDDVLDGGSGDDVLEGGLGFDVLAGGFGGDRFVFKSLDGSVDRIADFEIGMDVIDLSGILRGLDVNAANFDAFVLQIPLGATELTGFLAIDLTGRGNASTAVAVAQLDGAPFALGPTGSAGQLGFDDLIV